MNLQPAGVLLAGLTFITIAAGHVLVRRLHARYGTRPGLPLILAGVILLAVSLFFSVNLISAAVGITAITVLWDGVEIFRQERRLSSSRL